MLSHIECGCEMLCLRCFFFQAEDGIRDLVRSRGLGDVYKRQLQDGEDDDVIHFRFRLLNYHASFGDG